MKEDSKVSPITLIFAGITLASVGCCVAMAINIKALKADSENWRQRWEYDTKILTHDLQKVTETLVKESADRIKAMELVNSLERKLNEISAQQVDAPDPGSNAGPAFR